MATAQAISLIRRALTRGGLLAAALVAALATGCVTTDQVTFWKADKVVEPRPAQMACVWQNNILNVPDTTRGGQPMPGLAGRVYFFGDVIDQPRLCDGGLGVSVFDESSGQPVFVEHFEIDPETLKRLAKKKDFLGDGYTVFLPMTKWRADMSKLRLRTAFKAATAQSPIFSENVITLAADNGVVREVHSSSPTPGVRPGVPVGPLGVNPNMSAPTLPAPNVVR